MAFGSLRRKVHMATFSNAPFCASLIVFRACRTGVDVFFCWLSVDSGLCCKVMSILWLVWVCSFSCQAKTSLMTTSGHSKAQTLVCEDGHSLLAEPKIRPRCRCIIVECLTSMQRPISFSMPLSRRNLALLTVDSLMNLQ